MQGGMNQPGLLGFMDLADAGRRCGSRRTPGVQHLTSSAQGLLEAMTDLVPGTLVLWLLLTPHNLARIRIPVECRLVLFGRERIELLDSHQCDVALPVLAASL